MGAKDQGVDFVERRSGVDRRTRNLSAYLYGGLVPRRLSGRRKEDRLYPIVDWHSPRVLALVIAILGLCAMDGVLTVVLMQHGAIEANPFMALFVPHNLTWFAAVKLGLTAIGLIVLVACSTMRLMRVIPGEAVLYAILTAYGVLVSYELQLLPQLQEAHPVEARAGISYSPPHRAMSRE
ncbi:MAG: DUF5658 family protein [Steroidobacteraceae bacterium]